MDFKRKDIVFWTVVLLLILCFFYMAGQNGENNDEDQIENMNIPRHVRDANERRKRRAKEVLGVPPNQSLPNWLKERRSNGYLRYSRGIDRAFDVFRVNQRAGIRRPRSFYVDIIRNN